MFQHLIVPIDGSAHSWTAFPIATRMAQAVAGKVEVVAVVDRLADVALARDEIARDLERYTDLPVDPIVTLLARDDAAAALADHAATINGSMVLMSSHGHGRSAAVLGSTVDELLRLTFGPIIVIGPHASLDTGSLDGSYVVPLDASHAAESAAPIAAAWSVEFGATPWIVEVIDPAIALAEDVVEWGYPARFARDLALTTSHPIEHEVLHGVRPSRAIVEFANQLDASLIFMSTHGRSGMDRLRLGSVASEVVRHASCPVVLNRPPHMK
jgi:nucleotide-binding universal stress UspA family protein